VAELSTDRARHAVAPSHQRQLKRALLGAVRAIALTGALAVAASPAAADTKLKHKHKETEHVSKEPFGKIPNGPLQIIISIDQQKLHFYSDGTEVADTLVATGVANHPTPMGVFSVIEKDRFHHSNIYSGAPMPYMQRITWSGVAMHEGVGLGHPASHGCIRMAHEFAERLWALHSLGARVIIAGPELRPVVFADAHLFVHREKPPAPVPSVAAPAGVKTAQTVDSSKTTDAVGELRTGILTADPVAAAAAAPASTVERATDMNDAALALRPAIPEPVLSQEEEDAADTATDRDAVDPPPTAADIAPNEGATASGPTIRDAVGPQAPTTAEVNEPAATEASKPETPNSADAKEPAGPVNGQKVEPAAPAAAEAPETNNPTGTAAAVAAPGAAAETVPVPLPKPAELARAATRPPIAIFISRKERRIYVRQHFSPLFDAPIAIDHPEQQLGTHVFTAMEYLDDGSSFRWNVVSLPGEPPKTARNPDNEKKSAAAKRRDERAAKPLPDPAPPPTPQNALARIEIPADVIDRISQLIVPGSSLIVSDQGLGGETGEGTDFIVVTH